MTDEEIAELDAYLDDLVADWPPLTEEQVTRVQTLLNTPGTAFPAPRQPSEAERKRRDAEQRLSKLRAETQEVVESCAGCGVTRSRHNC